jgi:predicted enzyme related to lactoylglutathione lyase
MLLLGLRTVIYPAPDLNAAKAWFSALLQIDPYFDEPFYVGFNVAGYELALDPHGDPADGPITYWGVPDAAAALSQLTATGATSHTPLRDVGDGIRVASVREPGGAVFAVIENPHFEAHAIATHDGPGR